MVQRSRRCRAELDLLLDQLNRRLTGWVLGTGLLAFHAGVFFLTMTGVFFWNAYHSPTDFWAADLLRRWGAVLILHAVVTVATTVGWRLLRTADIQEASGQQWRPLPALKQGEVTIGSWRALDGPRQPAPEPIPAPGDEFPRLTAAQRFRNRAAERLAAVRGKIAEPAAEDASWPAPPVRRDVDADELIRQFGAGDTPIEDQVIQKPRKPSHARWSWVEASATRWVTKKDVPDSPPDRRPNTATPAPPASTPDDDEPFAL